MVVGLIKCEGCNKKLDILDVVWIKFEERPFHYESPFLYDDPVYLVELPFCKKCAEDAKKGKFDNFWRWVVKCHA